MEKHRHFQPEEEANTFCLGQRCPRAFSALPSTKELHWGVKEQLWFRLGMDTANLGLSRRCQVVQGELSLLWEKSMGNSESISKCAVPKRQEVGQTLDDYTLTHHEKTEKQN